MNIYKLFDKFDGDKRELLNQGFQNSCFNRYINCVESLFKELIQLYTDKYSTEDETRRINPQTGTYVLKGINKNNNNDKLTFGSDIKIILNNLVAIIGREFSVNILIITYLPINVKRTIEAMNNVTTYKELLMKIYRIRNIYSISNWSIFTDNRCINNNNTIMFNQSSGLKEFFNNIISEINMKIKIENNVNFDDYKKYLIETLNDLYDHTTYNVYHIKSVDNLCLYLGRYQPCYNNYFLKLWELLFKESYSDYYEYENVYPKFNDSTIENDMNRIDIPFTHVIDMNKEKQLTLNCLIDKTVNALVGYFRYLYDYTRVTINNNDNNMKNNKNIINVVIENYFYEYISNIIVNMLFNLSKNIVVIHNFSNTLSKSVKLQFIEIFEALRLTTPVLYKYTESQLYCLHYILLTKKVIYDMNESLTNSQNEPKQRKPRGKRARAAMEKTIKE